MIRRIAGALLVLLAIGVVLDIVLLSGDSALRQVQPRFGLHVLAPLSEREIVLADSSNYVSGIFEHVSAESGYDLLPYAGKRVRLRSYLLFGLHDLNIVRLVLLLDGDTVVGAYGSLEGPIAPAPNLVALPELAK